MELFLRKMKDYTEAPPPAEAYPANHSLDREPYRPACRIVRGCHVNGQQVIARRKPRFVRIDLSAPATAG